MEPKPQTPKPEISEIHIIQDLNPGLSPYQRTSQSSSPENCEIAKEKLGLNFQKIIMNNLIEQSGNPVIFENDYMPFISSQAKFIEKL
jgi:hypothetical protein